ncbi:MAG: PHB depolymerase family esterase [Myxococcota bacterium]|nr:PHB depolymerase family esterase [Myxococcota bacterium]
MSHQRTLAAPFGSRTRAATATSGLTVAVTLFLASSASAGQVQQITNFGNNPTGIGMYLYTPTNVAAKPPVLVGVHACHGKGTDVCSVGGGWVAQADKLGFLLVCPSAVSSDGCWDVHSTAVLTHNGGGDATGIVSMVSYVVQNKNADANRVYAAGHSSGGMMTNVLLGSYPDVFKAGAAFAGVAFGCFAVGSVDSTGWNSSCANGNVTQTAVQWGDTVRAADPGFTGTRPRMQLWHGTADAIVKFPNFGEEIKEWTNVLGVSATPISTENNAIQAGWVRTRYADSAGVVRVEAIQETGQPHNLVVNQAEAIHFLGLDGTGPVTIGGASDGGVDAQTAAGDSGTLPSGSDSGAAGTDGGGGAPGSGGDAGGDDGGGAMAAGYDGGSLPSGSTPEGGAMGNGSDDAGVFGGGTDGASTHGPGQPGPQPGGCSVGNGRATGTDAYLSFGLLLLAAACGGARRRRGRLSV